MIASGAEKVTTPKDLNVPTESEFGRNSMKVIRLALSLGCTAVAILVVSTGFAQIAENAGALPQGAYRSPQNAYRFDVPQQPTYILHQNTQAPGMQPFALRPVPGLVTESAYPAYPATVAIQQVSADESAAHSHPRVAVAAAPLPMAMDSVPRGRIAYMAARRATRCGFPDCTDPACVGEYVPGPSGCGVVGCQDPACDGMTTCPPNMPMRRFPHGCGHPNCEPQACNHQVCGYPDCVPQFCTRNCGKMHCPHSACLPQNAPLQACPHGQACDGQCPCPDQDGPQRRLRIRGRLFCGQSLCGNNDCCQYICGQQDCQQCVRAGMTCPFNCGDQRCRHTRRLFDCPHRHSGCPGHFGNGTGLLGFGLLRRDWPGHGQSIGEWYGFGCERPDWWFLYPQTEPIFGINPLIPPGTPHEYRGFAKHLLGQHPVANVAPEPPLPTYTTRGPRDFFLADPPSIGY